MKKAGKFRAAKGALALAAMLAAMIAAAAVTLDAADGKRPQDLPAGLQGELTVKKYNPESVAGRVYEMRVTAREQPEQSLNGQGAGRGKAPETTEVRVVVNQRFRLREGEQAKDPILTERPDGSTELVWRVELGQAWNNSFERVLLLEAKEEFVGGNQVCAVEEGSGLYREGRQVLAYPAPGVNVPVQFHVSSLEEIVAPGETPRLFRESGQAAEKMYQTGSAFCGGEATGQFRLTWLNGQGEEMISPELSAPMGEERERQYLLRAEFIPAQDGAGSPKEAGEPAVATARTGYYTVRVSETETVPRLTGE